MTAESERWAQERAAYMANALEVVAVAHKLAPLGYQLDDARIFDHGNQIGFAFNGGDKGFAIRLKIRGITKDAIVREISKHVPS